MSPAVTTIPATTGDDDRQTCMSCVGDLSDSALKCGGCQGYVHLRCSRLPEYQLIRLAVSQISYNCSNCVATKDLQGDGEKLKIETAMIQELIAKEVSIIDLDTSSNDTVVNTGQNGENGTVNELEPHVNGVNDTNHGIISPAPNNNSGGDDASTNRRPNCRYYLRQSCKHGRKGTGCKFEHPKLCFKYIKNGDLRGGCKEGSSCSFVHPKLCNSYKTRVCKRKNCSYFHVRNTKFSPDETTGISTTHVSPHDRDRPQRNEFRGPERQTTHIVQRPQHRESSNCAPSNNSGSDSLTGNGQVDQRDFLEMKTQIKMIQETLQLLLVGRTTQLAPDRAPPALSLSTGWGPQ